MEAPVSLRQAFDAYLEAKEKLQWRNLVPEHDLEAEAEFCWAEFERLLIDSARKA